MPKHVKALLKSISTSMLLAVFLSGCMTAEKRTDCKVKDVKCLKPLYNSSELKKDEYWKKYLLEDVSDRIFIAPPELAEFINIDNRRYGYPETTKPSVNIDESLLQDIRDAFAELPEVVSKQFDSNFAGIFLVEDLGSTGFSDLYTNKYGSAAGGFVILDSKVLAKRKANEWATWKENTPFKGQGSLNLSAIIEAPAHDNRKQAIQYILLHELAHVFAISSNINPDWTKKDTKKRLANVSFGKISWMFDEDADEYASKDQKAFPERKKVHYYFNADLANQDMLVVYDNLEKTDFPTLYAATNMHDDFAEAYVSYVHSVLMGKPWNISISQNGKVLKEFGLCWGEKRCAAKEKVIQSLFN